MKDYTDSEGITYDEDCPAMTEEEIERSIYLMKKYKTRILTREIYEREGLIKKATA